MAEQPDMDALARQVDALFEGKSFDNPGPRGPFDFGLPTGHRPNTPSPWTDVGHSDPIGDLRQMQEALARRSINQRRQEKLMQQVFSVANALMLGHTIRLITPDRAYTERVERFAREQLIRMGIEAKGKVIIDVVGNNNEVDEDG